MRWPAPFWYLPDAVVSISDDTQQEFMKINAVRPEKAHVIYNGIDECSFNGSTDKRDALKSELGIALSDVVIGSVGRLCPEKDFMSLLDAYKCVIAQCPATRLLIVGDGNLKADLKAHAREIGIDGRVIFTGLRNDVQKLMGVIDVFVMSSVSEGMPLALLEAMASGKPSVVTVGGNIEVAMDGVTSFMAPPNSPDILARKVIDLIRIPFVRRLFQRRRNKELPIISALTKWFTNMLSCMRRCCARKGWHESSRYYKSIPEPRGA